MAEATIDGATNTFQRYITPVRAERFGHHGERAQERMAMTESWLKERGIVYGHEKKGQDIYTIGKVSYKPFIKTIEIFFGLYLTPQAQLFDGQVILHGLDMNDPQGDKVLVAILKEMGADIEVKGDGGHYRRKAAQRDSDMRLIPDMVPALAVGTGQREDRAI